MQTTNLFVEQVLIGMLVALAGVMLIAPHELQILTGLTLTETALLVASVYLLGIVYDRFSDTLVEELEQHQRLLTALERWKKMCESPKKDPATHFPQIDLFPEDKLRMAMLRSERLGEYGSYLRSRIRLMRALTTLLPALALGLVMVLVDVDKRGGYVNLPYFALAAYAVAFALTFIGRRPPRTEDLTTAKVYQEYWKSSGISRGTGSSAAFRAVLRSRAMLTAVLLTIAAASFLWRVDAGGLALLPIIGFAGTLFVGWVWWRITSTFHRLLLAM